MPPTLNTHYSMRSATLGGLNKKDYIEELTKQLDVCQKVQQATQNRGACRRSENPLVSYITMDSWIPTHE